MTEQPNTSGPSTVPTDTATQTPWLESYPDDIDWSAPIQTTPLTELFDRAVREHGAAPCVDFLGKRYSYAEIGDLVARTARGLLRLGVGKGSKVGLYLPNTPYYVVAYYAVLKCGATVVNFNPLHAKQEVLWQVRDSEITVLITLDVELLWSKVEAALAETDLQKVIVCKMADVLPFPKNLLFPWLKRRNLAKVAPDPRVVSFEELCEGDEEFQPIPIGEDDPAVFQYTGGTTGTPKAAVLLHKNIAANTHQVRMLVPEFEDATERFLGVLPLCHVFAMTVVMNLAIATASEMVLLPRFELDQVLATIAKKRPTVFPGVPAIYAAINESRRVDRRDLTSLKFCISGGASLPLEVKRRFEKLTGCKLVEGYGLSESSPVAACNPIHGRNKEGSIGIPVPGTRIAIHSLEEPDRPVPVGDRGEVCIQGPQLMREYWNQPDETADTIVDGWLHTGDVGVMDEDGYTFIVDRIKDVIFRGGYNVYPRIVEEAIYQHPLVAECCVCGIPDELKGECPIAFVRLEDGGTLTAAALLDFLEDKISKVEMPTEIEFRTEPLPKTPIGKPSKRELIAEFLSRRDGAREAS